LIAGIIVGPAAAGVFELATRLAMGAQAFGAASAAALTPHLTRSYVAHGMDGILAQYERLTQRNSAVAILVPLGLIATAASAIPLWLGHSNDDVLWVLLALLPGIAINVSTAVCSSTLSALGRPAVIAKVTLVAGTLLVASAVTLGTKFGLVGIAIAFAIGEPTLELVGLWYMHRRLEIPLKLYFRGSCGPYTVGIIAVSIALPIGLLAAPYSRESAVWPFIASAVLFGATYIFTCWHRHYLPRISLRRQKSPTSAEPHDGN
jgi:O-antigen/teichoic acid export membrane protein